MDILLVAGVISFIVAILVAIIILIRDRKSVNRWLGFFLIFGASWSLLASFQSSSHSEVYNLYFARAAFATALMMSFALLHFTSALTERKFKRDTHFAIAGVLIVTIAMALSPLIISDVTIIGGRVIPDRQPLYFFVAFLLLVTSFISIRMVFQKRKQVSQILERQRYTIVLVGLIIGISSGIATNILLPNILGSTYSSQYAWVATLLWTTILGYAIVKHQFLDIRFAAVRTLAYGLVLLSLSAIYYVLAYVVSVAVLGGQTTSALSVSPVNVLLALLLAFLFQPIKYFFDQITNSIFYRRNYKSEEFFANLSELLASTTDLRGLLERASKEIAATLKAEQSFFFLYYADVTTHHLSAGTHGHKKLPIYDANTLKSYIESHKEEIFLTDHLLNKDEDIRRLLVSHEIALLMPLRHRDRIIGYLCLGDRLTSNYSKRDLKVLTTIAGELVIAIQNALSVLEIREINASLQQRIRVATAELRESNAQLHRLDTAKNEFVSMASHQLRTPLTSVKGYISMMLDGDVGKISEAQKNALQEAFNSSERMVRLIGDFLSVSRLQTGKFMIEKKPIDLTRVIEQEVDGLRIIASTHGQKLAFVHPKKGLVVAIDEAKIRQVIMNFIDNAIYYSRTNSTIHVSLSKLEKEIVFTVEDTGIGVPTEEQHKLFNKFYRATNARQQRPDGTGVGLFLAKKIVTAHDGRIIFSSTVGQGSTFGFRIPLKQEDEKDEEQKA